MNEDTLKGQWMQLKGKALEKWGKLTKDDLDVVQGRTDQLIGRVQERYGIARAEAERQVKEFMTASKAGTPTPTPTSTR